MPKKRTRTPNATSKKSKKKNNELDGELVDEELPAVAERRIPSAKRAKSGNPKKKITNNDNDSSSSISSSSSSISSSSSSGNDKATINSEDSDNDMSENEMDYDMSAALEYYWLIGKVHMDADDKKMYVTTRVEIDRNGYVVAYRKAVDLKGRPVGKELKDSYHVADIVEYTQKSTHLLSASNSSSSISTVSSISQPTSADAISNSLKCEVNGCNEDQYDVCAIECKKMLCAKHIKLHEQKKCCQDTVK